MEKQEAYQRAEKRVKAKFGFLIHLTIYIIVNIMLIIINLNTSPQYLWFKWPLIGWGIGLFFHAVGLFTFSGGSALKKRWIEKEMKKEL
ncbi:MAG: 2TM domain-containing protein [Desulfobacteraceae bacterium]|nr:2TM domain-containing protein [Desulfobacteraceae bacterium]